MAYETSDFAHICHNLMSSDVHEVVDCCQMSRNSGKKTEFEPGISASERPLAHAIDRTTTVFGRSNTRIYWRKLHEDELPNLDGL